MNRPAKAATGMDGKKIKVGDHVISRCGVKGTVLKMWKQGYDGTIIQTDTAPDPDSSKYHFQGAARSTYRKA